ncbi:MAG TPA: phage tail protein, partial [Roseiflexaceae bacterium]
FVVLDRKYKLIWVFDATIRPDPLRPERSPEALLFQPKTGPQRLRLPAGDSQPILLADADTPISVEPLPDGTLLVLDRAALDAATVRRYERHGGPALASVELREPSLRDLGAPPLIGAGRELAIQAHDFAFVPRQGSGESLGTLFVVNPGGNQAFALEVLPGGGLKLRLLRAYYPLRGYTGKALVAPPGEASAFFDQDERWLPVISLDRPRYEPSGTLDVPILDGREPGCVWHRLCLDACIPPETTVRVLTRSADTEDLIAWQPWREEPSLYLRGGGAELPYYQLWSQDELRQPHVGTWALLFQRAHGRYLAVRLVLEGNGRSTPCIRALRAHYPRFSYLSNYLPGLYQDDAVSASFLDRFLANPEGLLTTLEGQIAEAQVFWDARTAPAEALEWLAGWLGIALDPAWSEHRRRLLIAYAPVFFLRRGTLTGLAQAIRLATDDQPGPEIFQDEYDDRCSPVRIVERFRTRRVPGVVVGDPDDQTGPSGSILAVARERAHRFVVLLPAATSDTQVALVERLAELEKPAHTFVVVKRYWALFRTGEARVGLDTRLGEGGRFELLRLGETALAEGMLGARHPFDLTGRTVLGV